MDSMLAQSKTVIEAGEPLLFDPNFLNLQYFFNAVLTFFKWLTSFSGGILINGTIADKETLENIFLALSAVLIWSIFYIFMKLRKLRGEEEGRWSELHISAAEIANKSEHSQKWEQILDRLDSFNESDWRIAIISADTILEEMLDKMGYYGETIGEKLKAIEESDFLTLSQAWEAHKVRNKIAHEGDFALTKREARRVIDLYREVFEEFHFI